MRNVPGIGLYFVTIDFLQQAISGNDSSLSPVAAAAAGIGARTFAGILLLPMSLLKTKYESGLFKYSSLSNAVLQTYAAGKLLQ
jgi:solute carrier family 25 protein 38